MTGSPAGPGAYMNPSDPATGTPVLPRLVPRAVGVALALLFAVSALASVVRFLARHAADVSAATGVTMAVFAAVVALLLRFAARSVSDREERRAAIQLLVVTFALKLLLVCVWRDFPQTGDRLFLSEFVDRWAAGGDGALRGLSREVYDYPVWAARAWPFLFPVRACFPGGFILATQLLNCVLSTALVAAIWLLTRRLVRRPLVPLALAALSPVFFWGVLDYSYQFQTALLIVAAFALFRGLADPEPQTSSVRWAGRSALLGVTLFLLHLQQGFDLVFIALFAAMSLYAGLAGRSWPRAARLAVRLLVVPAALWLPASRAADAWISARDEGRLSSGFIGHMAYGWNLETWGEYYGPVVALDRQTPPDRKRAVMLDYIARQIRERPVDALVKLPVVKTLKLFQLGAASGAEEAFAETGATAWAGVFKGMRLVFAPLVLALAAAGVMRFVRHGGTEVLAWGLFLLGLVAAYTFFSETSPRYSFYFQFTLFAAAACAVARLSGCPEGDGAVEGDDRG